MEQPSFYGIRKGTYARISESVKDNDQALSRFEFIYAPGTGAPQHYHTSYDEQYEVTEGELTIWACNIKFTLKAGETFVIKRNILHRLQNESNKECRVTITVEPGQEILEQTSKILSGLYHDGQLNNDGLPRNPLIRALLMLHTDTVPACMKRFHGFYKWLYKRALRRGLYEKLLDKYVLPAAQHYQYIQLQSLVEAIGA